MSTKVALKVLEMCPKNPPKSGGGRAELAIPQREFGHAQTLSWALL